MTDLSPENQATPAASPDATAEAAAWVRGTAPPRAMEDLLREAGLEMVGACDRLSAWPGLMTRSALLQDFSAAEADLLGQAMLLVRARAGQLLIAEDGPSDWMMLLLSGTVDVGKRKIGSGVDGSEGAETTRLAVLRSGALVGEMSMLDGEPRYGSCWALSDVEAAVINRAGVARLITAHPGVGAKLLVKLTQLLAQRLRNTSNQLIRSLQQRAQDR